MENATKALLIAGAVLLVIMIISVSLMIFNSANGQVSSAVSQMNQQEKIQFNQKFLAYEGKKVTGSTVKELFNLVRVHNIQMKNDGTPEKYVSISLQHEAETGHMDAFNRHKTGESLKLDKNNIDNESEFEGYYEKIVNGAKYAVKTFINTKTGLVYKILIARN